MAWRFHSHVTSVSESFSVFLNVWGQLPVPSHSGEPIASAILPKSPGEAVGHAFFTKFTDRRVHHCFGHVISELLFRKLLRPRRERPRGSRAAECGQQFPPSDGDCHTPLPCEVRKDNDTTPRARCPNCVAPGAGTSGIGLNGSPPEPRSGLLSTVVCFAPASGPHHGMSHECQFWTHAPQQTKCMVQCFIRSPRRRA